MKRSRTRRVSFFVPMLTAALIVVGWRAASAGPCIPDGQACKTGGKCCGGVCVKPSKKSSGTCCSPTTCAAAFANCGMIADGCGGTLDCGTCTLPQTCGGGGTPNHCGSPTQCCMPSSPMGAFDTCTVETLAQCAAQGGIDQGPGTCSPNPCCGLNGEPCCDGTTCLAPGFLGCSGGICTQCPSTTTTTTLPMCTVGAAFCPSNGVCLNGHTCVVDGGTGLCDCTGPTPTCNQWGIIACGGTCPAGAQCALENIAPPGCPQVPVCGCVPAP